MAGAPLVGGDEASLRAQLLRLERLQAFTAALSEALTPSDVAAVAWGPGLSALDTTSGAFMLLNADASALELCGSSGMAPEVVAHFVRLPMHFPIPVVEAV